MSYRIHLSVINKIYKAIRKQYCYIHEDDIECSQFTPGAIWGMDYYYITVKYLIPFWIKDETEVEAYIEKYYHKDWLYLEDK